MSPALPDLEKDSRKQRAESLFSHLGLGLDAMRQDLETDRVLEAGQARDRLRPELDELAGLLGRSAAVTACLHMGSGADSLQSFRRAALADLETLRQAYREMCETAWRSRADAEREAAVRKSLLRWGAALGACAVLLAGWWGCQAWRQRVSRAQIDRAKNATAAQAVKLIGMTAWLAQKTQGKPLHALAKDMASDCGGIDVQRTLPNHPCREAWATHRQALFMGAVPAPGKPVDAPSEIFFDPWGAPYILLLPENGTARVVSAGPDGRLGTADDIGADIPYWGMKTR